MCEITETQALRLVCFARYSAADARDSFPDFPVPDRVVGKRKFYKEESIKKFIKIHGNISGKITIVGWKMPSKMAIDFVKGVYS